MVHVELLNVAELRSLYGERYPQQIREGTAEGVRLAGEGLADDVSANTPDRTGKAAAFVRNRQTSEFTATVDYDPKEAFYMRFVQLGTRPHPIIARGLRGGREQRRLASYARRHFGQHSIDWTSQMSSSIQDGRGNSFGWFERHGKGPKALTVGGKLYARVMHPGITANKILVNRLLATQDKLSLIVKGAIEGKVGEGAVSVQ